MWIITIGKWSKKSGQSKKQGCKKLRNKNLTKMMYISEMNEGSERLKLKVKGKRRVKKYCM